jgi:excisionase family DNA binding protein
MEENRVSFSKDEVARRLGVSRDSVSRAIQKGKLRVVRFGRRVLIPGSEIERLLRGRRSMSEADSPSDASHALQGWIAVQRRFLRRTNLSAKSALLGHCARFKDLPAILILARQSERETRGRPEPIPG